MADFLYDSLTGTPGASFTNHVADVGGTWTVQSSTSDNAIFRADGTGLYVASANRSHNYVNSVTPPSAEYDITFVKSMSSSGDKNNLILARIASPYGSSADCYYVFTTSSTIYLRKVVGGVLTTLATVSYSIPDGTNTFRFKIRNNEKTFFVNGTPVAATADNQITGAGRVGFATGGSPGTLESVSAAPSTDVYVGDIALRSFGGQVDGNFHLTQSDLGGAQNESGGSTATVAVNPEGAGTYVDEPTGQHESGGSTATVTVDPEGAGTAVEAASGGSTADVTVDAEVGSTFTDLFLIVAMQDGGDVDLTWAAQAGATGYAVERDGAVIAWDVQTATYTDIAPSTGEHTYRVGVIV